MKVDEDNIINIGGNYNNTILDDTRRARKPHRRRDKKLTVEDAEEEFGAYYCDIEGCAMSFTSKQELNLHKRSINRFLDPELKYNRSHQSHMRKLRTRAIKIFKATADTLRTCGKSCCTL